ncbi:MAG: tyrosine-protein phosphatase [Erysipelotrichaceae bacterium]|nr:tyrosine-protein phosphatase [Erysipelotrichaceae bacterium]
MKKKNRVLLFVAIVTLLFSYGCEKKKPEVEEMPMEETVVRTYITEDQISSFGNIYTNLEKQALFDAGFEPGDILTISFLDQKVDAPLVSAYSDVTSLSTGIFALANYDTITLAINMGDFASYYGVAEKIAEGDKVIWKLKSDPLEMTFTLKEKGGYLDEYMIMQLKYSNEREDYPQLSDEEFANFRSISTSGMGKNILYRSSSTVDDTYNRAKYADLAAARHHIAFILNLINNEADLKDIPGYEETYFSSVNHLAKSTNLDVKSEENRKDTAEFMRVIANNKGPYLVQCLKGTDRTGFFCAILECLMGASYDEIVDDYMVTYYNWNGVTKDDKAYQIIADKNIINTLKTVFGTDDLKNADLQTEAHTYLLNIGLSEKEIEDIKSNLSVDFQDIE